MARYGGEYGQRRGHGRTGGYDAGFGGRGYAGEYRTRRRQGAEYDRDYSGGWGMTRLFNDMMRGAGRYDTREYRSYSPRGSRYGREYGGYDRELHGVRLNRGRYGR